MQKNLIRLKSTIRVSQLKEYYETLEKDYQDYKWSVPSEDQEKIYGKTSNVKDIYGWAIKSKSIQNIKNKPAYHLISKKFCGDESLKTDLFFGIIERLDEEFPYFYDHAILVHPPEASAYMHSDTNLKIHIPIITNDQSMFLFENEKHNLKADGSMYFTNTLNNHGVINDGNSIRVHLIVKVPKDRLYECLEKKVYIKV